MDFVSQTKWLVYHCHDVQHLQDRSSIVSIPWKWLQAEATTIDQTIQRPAPELCRGSFDQELRCVIEFYNLSTCSFELCSVLLLTLLNNITESEDSHHPPKDHCVFAGEWSQLHSTLGTQTLAEGAVQFRD